MSSTSDHFTASAKHALSLSHFAALREGSDEIGPEHLMLALVWQRTTIAVRAFRSIGVYPEPVMRALSRSLGFREFQPLRRITLAPDTEQAMRAAAEAARRMGDTRIGTGHLLLGILALEEGVADHALRALRVDLPYLRRRIARLIADSEVQER
jgi:ATP-dependent Clp protease ATP-binding subunit ClpC